jgi:hypothetical protein
MFMGKTNSACYLLRKERGAFKNYKGVRTHVNFTQYVSLAHGCCFGRPTFGGNWLQVTHARLNLGAASRQKIGKKACWTKRRLLRPSFLSKRAKRL